MEPGENKLNKISSHNVNHRKIYILYAQLREKVTWLDIITLVDGDAAHYSLASLAFGRLILRRLSEVDNYAMDAGRLCKAWDSVASHSSRSPYDAFIRRCLPGGLGLGLSVCFSDAHKKLKRPPTAVPVVVSPAVAAAAAVTSPTPPQLVCRPFNSNGFHFGKAPGVEVLCQISLKNGQIQWEGGG